MNKTVAEILTPLDPLWDRIIRRPMSETEIDDLSNLVGLPVPKEFRDYLRHVGLFQDLTHWNVSSIEMFEKPEEFSSARAFLTETLIHPQPDLFPFGGDGNGNLFCLPSDEGKICSIHFVDHGTGKVKQQKAFSVWLESIVKKVLKNIEKRPLNEQKVWCVQFSFSKTVFLKLIELMSTVWKMELIDPDWMNHDTSPANVTSSDRRIRINGIIIKVRQLKYAGWEVPLLSFNMQEPCLIDIAQSKIRMLDALFKKKCPDYTLVDYGPMDSKGLVST